MLTHTADRAHRAPLQTPPFPFTNTTRHWASGADRDLQEYVSATDETRARRVFSRLLDCHAAPIVERVLRRWYGFDLRKDEEEYREVFQETMVHLTTRLQRHREVSGTPDAETPIRDFGGYVAVVTRRRCVEALRQKRPAFRQCQDRLRYVLRSSPTVQVGKDAAGRTVVFPCQVHSRRTGETPETAELRERLFEALSGADRPQRLDVLTSLLAGETSAAPTVGEISPLDSAEETESIESLLAHHPADRLDQRDYLRRLWEEIGALSHEQRSALLLNLRDDQGRGVIELMPYVGMACLDQIADSLGLSDDAFVDLRDRLPLADVEIAALLGTGPRQVINLRVSARRRLTRRLSPTLENRDAFALPA